MYITTGFQSKNTEPSWSPMPNSGTACLTTSCWLIHCWPFGANWNIICYSSPTRCCTVTVAQLCYCDSLVVLAVAAAT